jgi:SWI/SNF-related matrix-associated actin-dependent regulator of chromatin subfamily A3
MVERGLLDDADSNHQHVRIDGKVTAKKRGQILRQFHNDTNIRVILITISCGAFGYAIPLYSCAYFKCN